MFGFLLEPSATNHYANEVGFSSWLVGDPNKGSVGGVPISDGHWADWLAGDLMFSSIFKDQPVTVITIGAFEDIGYEMDWSMAEPLVR